MNASRHSPQREFEALEAERVRPPGAGAMAGCQIPPIDCVMRGIIGEEKANIYFHRQKLDSEQTERFDVEKILVGCMAYRRSAI